MPRFYKAGLLCSWFALTCATTSSYITASFLFDWNDPSQVVPQPITEQCESIHITWGRQAQTGPSPTAPYFLQIYTSTFIVPFIVDAGSGLSFDWAVPFAPGTIYQICMFDSKGNTGGCQAMYTVIPSSSTTCQNITFPGVLDVEATVSDGALSQFGWIPSCTDISVLPKNGTGPYTLTVAPSLHPPYNITAPSMTAINWTVELSWASPFFISLSDSAGNSWSQGPLHSGFGTTKCLDTDQQAVNNTTTTATGVPAAAAVGSAIGGLVLGALAGLASAICFMRRRRRETIYDEGMTLHKPAAYNYERPQLSGNSRNYHRVNTILHDGDLTDNPASPGTTSYHNTLVNPGESNYTVEPFRMPGEDGQLQPNRQGTTDAGSTTAASSERKNQLYVLHHDAGRPPVTIYTADGTDVVELPPRYFNEGTATDSGASTDRPSTQNDNVNDTNLPPVLQQPRRPNIPRKQMLSSTSNPT